MNILRPAVSVLLLATAVCGLAYPTVLTGFAQLALAGPANGSVATRDGVTVGSRLIGQRFTNDRYFWSRPSATPDRPYNAAFSSGSNLGPTNPALRTAVEERRALLIAAH